MKRFLQDKMADTAPPDSADTSHWAYLSRDLLLFQLKRELSDHFTRGMSIDSALLVAPSRLDEAPLSANEETPTQGSKTNTSRLLQPLQIYDTCLISASLTNTL